MLNTWSKANNQTPKYQVHPLTSGSTDFIWGGGVILHLAHSRSSTVETVSACPDLQFYHGRLSIYFWFEVKGSGGAEKWRGLLKVRAAFLRCSGGHPSSYFTQVDAHRSQSRCTPSTGKEERESERETGSQNSKMETERERQNIALKGMGRE